MKINKIINKIIMLLSCILVLVVGIINFSSVLDAVKVLKDNVYNLQHPAPTPALGFPIQNEPTFIEEKIIEFLSSYNFICGFLIFIFVGLIFLMTMSLFAIFFNVDKKLFKILQTVNVIILLVLSIVFLYNIILSQKVSDYIFNFDGDLVNEGLLISLELFGSLFDYVMSILFICCILLFLSNILFSMNDSVVSVGNEAKSETTEVYYQNVIQNKIAEADLKLKTLELEKDLEEKLKKIKSLEEK